ncbi:MAG: YraN family protein [Actinobacteria bacterium]|nr:YraN family protein [Actinomycetota bacterium]
MPHPNGGRHDLGRLAETAVASWYQDRGWEVLSRNWRCRQGELDVVASQGRWLAFCEVKARSSRRFGAPQEAVNWAKRKRLRLLAARWLAEQPDGVHRGKQIRFDVAGVSAGSQGLVIEMIEGAF